MSILSETLIALSPLYFYLLLGVMLHVIGVITDNMVQSLNRLIFSAFFPFSLFLTVFNARLNLVVNIDAILFILASIIILFILLIIVVPRIIKPLPVAATIVQGLFRTNFGLLGLVYITQLYGSENVGEIGILIAAVVLLFNILVVINFALLRGEKPNIRITLGKIGRNPLIISIMLALALKSIKFEIPDILRVPMEALSKVTIPVAMIVIGASLTFKGLQKNMKLISGITIARLLIIPGIFLPIAILCGFREVTLIALLTLFAGPTAVASCAMSYQLGGDGELAGQIVATTTVFSLLTMFLFTVLLRTFAFC